MKNVVIVGAGIIGLAMAKELASYGLDVTVYDGKKDVAEGSKKASGILSKKGLELSGIDYKDSIVNTLNGARLHFGRQTLNVNTKTVQAYVLDRGKLAELNYKVAKDAGADIKLGRRLGLEQIRDFDDGNTIIVGADGAVSSVARAFSFPKIENFVLTYKAEYRNVEISDKGIVDLYFSKSYAPGFFGWVAPYSDSVAELGIGITDNVKKHSIMAFDSFIKTEEVKRTIRDAELMDGHASIIPVSNRPKTAEGNVILVGDAAGQTKATTGGGIIFGIACAKVAAKSVYLHLKEGRKLSLYDRDWRRSYGADLKMHAALHSYYSKVGEAHMERFIGVAKALGAESFFAKYGDMDSPTLMLKRLFLRRLVK
ncbi:MAG: NAD(P)/FAD-dependent oxidoreductase [Methanothrix sp.]